MSTLKYAHTTKSVSNRWAADDVHIHKKQYNGIVDEFHHSVSIVENLIELASLKMVLPEREVFQT